MQRDPELIERARRMAVDAGPPPRTGPTRAELLETISAARNWLPLTKATTPN